jgi:hypothetical protein
VVGPAFQVGTEDASNAIKGLRREALKALNSEAQVVQKTTKKASGIDL